MTIALTTLALTLMFFAGYLVRYCTSVSLKIFRSKCEYCYSIIADRNNPSERISSLEFEKRQVERELASHKEKTVTKEKKPRAKKSSQIV